MFAQDIADRDYEINRIASVADEHRAWHAVNGPGNCPWDVAACDPDPYDLGMDDEIGQWTLADEIAWELALRGIPCGHCKLRHPSVDWVRACSGVFDPA